MFFLFALLNQNMLTLGNFTFINVPKGSLCLSLLPRRFRHESPGAGSEGRTGKEELLFFLCDQTSDSRNSREERLTWAPGFMRILWGSSVQGDWGFAHISVHQEAENKSPDYNPQSLSPETTSASQVPQALRITPSVRN